jgi:hypothetical protein
MNLRCTQKLLKHMGGPSEAPEVASSTRLGDWYANVVWTRPSALVLAVSQRTFLPVVIPAKEFATIGKRLPEALAEVLLALGVGKAAAQMEQREMSEVALRKTHSRQVVGVLTDFMRALNYRHKEHSLLEVSLWLAETPCSPLGMDSPDSATEKLFGQGNALRLVH